MPFILRVDNLNIVKWWMGASYAIHPDCRSHAGEIMSLGWGSFASMSKRKKLNSIISTESELIGTDDMIPEFLCSRYFIEAQGFSVEEAVVYQDNLSFVLLENNGRLSSKNSEKNTYASDTS